MSMNPLPQRTRGQQVTSSLAKHAELVVFLLGIAVGFLLSRV